MTSSGDWERKGDTDPGGECAVSHFHHLIMITCTQDISVGTRISLL